ncbi:MAG: type II toxin-antitoxin system Phd/YefM family antitoxin [Acidimicrobiia bacterium]
MNVGVRELKQGLSEYLDRVAGGEILTVTDRGTPKALIVPIPGPGELQRGIDGGWIREAHQMGLARIRRAPGRASTTSVLSEDRDQ